MLHFIGRTNAAIGGGSEQMTHGRFLAGLCVSSLSLAAVMLHWPQFFLFSKVARYPHWALTLPMPFGLPALIGAICLVPAAFVPKSLRQALIAALGASITASLILILASLSVWPAGYVLANAAFNFAWTLLPCAAAAIVLLALRFVARMLYPRASG